MTASQAKFELSRADMVEQLELRLYGDILVPKVADFDPATVTLENIVALLRREEAGEDISRGVIYTGDWHCKDRRVRNHNNVFISWPSEDGDTVLHKQLQGTEEDGAFIIEDLTRAALGGGVKYSPPKVEPKAANDNDPAAAKPVSTEPKLTADEEREYLEKFQREQLLPGERGELVFDDVAFRALSSGPFWRIADAVVEGHHGDVFMGVLDGLPKFAWDGGGIAPITPTAPFPLVDPSKWHGTVAQVRQWFLTGLVPHRQVTLLSGDGGVGKSLFGLQIGAASALAIETLGLQPQPGRVLYLGAEDEAEEFHRRLEDICTAHGAQMSDLTHLRILPLADQDALLSTPDKGGMKHTPLWARVDRFVKEWNPGLVVLDTAADLFGGDEVKRAEVRHFVAMLRTMAIQRDCAVLLLAHPSRAGMESGSGYSGSTAWNNSVRSRLYLTSGEGDVRILKTVKSNYGKIGEEIMLEWKDGAFVLHDPARPVITDALLNGRTDKVFLAVLSKMSRQRQDCGITKGAAYAPKLMMKHPEARGIKMSDLETAMQRLLDAGLIRVVEEGPPSKSRKRLKVSAECFGPDD
ncbi:AAA family ATPase [Bradyrhizobium sp. LB11.1]|uniref:AAA family ATPase n=1 Tax=Bradyrhizobium sp. LB11.1 TaxID=3156326 RepID=UPI003397B07E